MSGSSDPSTQDGPATPSATRAGAGSIPEARADCFPGAGAGAGAGGVSEWELVGSDGQPILGVTHAAGFRDGRGEGGDEGEGGEGGRGSVILCHGFKGYMDYGFLPRLAETLATAGFEVHRFNFSHSGMTRETGTFARPELFERETWNRQVFDLSRVIEHFGDGDADGCEGGVARGGRRRKRRVGVFGHSRGGVTALLTAARLGDAVAAVATAAAPADACRLDEDQRRQLRETGRLPSPSSRTGQLLHVGQEWLAEIEADPEGHEPLRAAANFGGMLLHLHGSEDDTVEVADLERYARANPSAQTAVIEGANHVFNAPNPLPPWAALPAATAELFQRVTGFFAASMA